MALFDDTEMAALRINRIVLHEIGKNDADFKLLGGVVDPGDKQEFFLKRLGDANQASSYRFLPDSGLAAALREVQANGDALERVGKAVAADFKERHRGNVNAGMLVIFELATPGRDLFAIVKFDGQHAVIREGDDGATRLTLLQKTIVESKYAMQMSAVIRLSGTSGELAVQSRRSGARISDYFLGFLGVERAFTNKEYTTRLSKALESTAIEHRAELEPEIFEDLRERFATAVEQFETFAPETTAMLEAVVGPLPEGSPVRDAFARNLVAEGIEHETFALDKAALKPTTRRRLVTRENIRVSYSAAYDENVRWVTDEVTGRTTITIESAGIEKHDRLP